MALFTITFTKSLKAKTVEVFFEYLVANLDRTFYKNMVKIDKNNLKVEGYLFPFFKYISLLGYNWAGLAHSDTWNIWIGFTKQTFISLNGNKAKYSIDYTYAIISAVINYLLVLVFIFTIVDAKAQFNLQTSKSILIYSSVIYWGFAIILNSVKLLKHYLIFNYTSKHGNKFIGKTNWDKIFRNKPLKELRDIANGKTLLTKEVQNIARKILNEREPLDF